MCGWDGAHVHELHALVTTVVVPLRLSARGQLVDAGVAHPYIVMASQLPAQLHHLRVYAGLEKWQRVVQLAPVGILGGRQEAPVVVLAVDLADLARGAPRLQLPRSREARPAPNQPAASEWGGEEWVGELTLRAARRSGWG